MKLKLIPNPKKPWANELASELKALLSPAHSFVRSGADATICIGGDGTILYAHYKGRLEGPVLGIGGDKSYICQLRKDNWRRRTPSPPREFRRESKSRHSCARSAPATSSPSTTR